MSALEVLSHDAGEMRWSITVLQMPSSTAIQIQRQWVRMPPPTMVAAEIVQPEDPYKLKILEGTLSANDPASAIRGGNYATTQNPRTTP
jgi:hypothetical protein